MQNYKRKQLKHCFVLFSFAKQIKTCFLYFKMLSVLRKRLKHLFSYFYILPFSETTWKYFFVCLYFIRFAKWSKLGETMPCFGQFRVTRKKYETVSPNINDHTNLAIVKVSIRVNRTRWIRIPVRKIILSTFLQTFCNHVDINIFCHLSGTDANKRKN